MGFHVIILVLFVIKWLKSSILIFFSTEDWVNIIYACFLIDSHFLCNWIRAAQYGSTRRSNEKKSYLSLRYKGSRLDLKVLTEHTCSLPNKPSKYRKPNNQSNKKKNLFTQIDSRLDRKLSGWKESESPAFPTRPRVYLS